MTHNLKTHRLVLKKIGNVNCQQRIGSSLAPCTLHKIPFIDKILATLIQKKYSDQSSVIDVESFYNKSLEVRASYHNLDDIN